jgi:branched-subunit amino acid transport protein
LSVFENNIIFITENFKLYSAIIAVLAVIVFNNVLITITLGMLSFLLMSNFLNI